MVAGRDYNAEAVEAARSVVVELVHLLGESRDHIVLVGGWVPEFICPNPQRPHVGSMDVDLALDHKHLTEAGYNTIRKLLIERGYEQADQPFRFFRRVKTRGHEIKVEVDFLAGQYEGTGKSHRTQKVQDIHLRKTRGADLAFDAPIEVLVEGELPDGGKDRVNVRVASIVSFLVMKAMALDDRLKEKDSWDIYFCILNYPGGVEQVVKEFRMHVGHDLVREGLEKLAKHFVAVDSIGPTHVANFEEVIEGEEREMLRRDAYERVHYLLAQLGII